MTANNPYRNIIESQKPELTKARRACRLFLLFFVQYDI